jgi:hypothetical protein
MVISQIQVGDTTLLEGIEPFRFGPEDKLLEDGGLDLCCGAFQIAYHDLCRTKHGVDPF